MSSEEENRRGDRSTKDDELDALRQRATSVFFIPLDENQLFSPLALAITGVGEPFAHVAQAFRANIAGLLSTIATPFTLANASAIGRSWQRIHTAERIRSLPLSGEDMSEDAESRREHEALARGREKMDEFMKSAEGGKVLIRDTLTFLDHVHLDESLASAASELLLQGILLAWGGFEVLARDSFIAYLNVNPDRSLSLQSDPITKRRFEMSKVPLETLAAHKFNLSERMGTLFAQQQDLSDVCSIKAAYAALFPADCQLRDALNDPDLRVLSLRRNLIVHQRGAVDEAYLGATKCTQHLGERLQVHPDEVEAHLRTVVNAAAAILRAVGATQQP